MPKIFISGTDTGIGKTYVSCQLLHYFNRQGLSTVGIKPLASGCDEGLRNEDALLLQKASSRKLPYETINPVALALPIAPHLAAEKTGISLSVDLLVKACQSALNISADIHLIEGAGGWLVPLNYRENISDFVMAIKAKVILVVGMKLGCLNHALLTYQAIQKSGCEILGWIANCISPDMLYLNENIETLKSLLPAPLLGTVPYNGSLSLETPALLPGLFFNADVS